jgi:DNA-binding transcriptional ArsR family regulator
MKEGTQQLAQEREKYEARARYIRALAHPARLFIVDELAASERCVNDLHALIGGDRTTLSKHLAVLRDTGVVIAEKRGAQVYYRLRTPCILGFFGCIEQALRQVATEQLEAAGGRRK